ncbi:flagellar motor switch protein FliN [Parasphingorhabdus litoris]|uniref:Flagellar motor switch protein FliN n=1 Tax=Parasphingorhabdus litoris TaxID=394733 RepID=A0ABN1A767_9SPHN|nr:flagellar motor switch protein FliN [Parasphingorhabdus litoris]
MSDPKEAQAPKKAKGNDKAPWADNENFRLLADIPVRLSVEVGSISKRLAEIMAFQEGEVVELDRQSEDLLDIMINGTLVAKGEVVTIDGRFGVRIAELANDGLSFPAVERR